MDKYLMADKYITVSETESFQRKISTKLAGRNKGTSKNIGARHELPLEFKG